MIISKPHVVLLVFLIASLFACNSQSNNTNHTPPKPATIADNDTKILKQLILSFFEDCLAEINKSDRQVTTYSLHPEAYQKRYAAFLSNTAHKSFSHLHPQLVAELKRTLHTCGYDPGDTKSIRACSEPIFQSPVPFTSLTIIGVDAEGDEAVVHTRHANSEQKTVFTLERIEGKWMIMERETIHAPKRKQVLPIDDWGVYKHTDLADQSYKIFKKDGQLTLEHCVKLNCTVKGVIIGSTTNQDVRTLRLKDFPTGELVPRWMIEGKQLRVFDYSAQEDKWIEAVYLQVEAEG